MTKKFDRLIEIMQTAPNPNDRVKAIQYLFQQEDKRAIDPLINTLRTDKYIWARIWAARALGRFRGKKVISILVEIAEDLEEDKTLREEAIKSLGVIGSSSAVKPLLNLLTREHERKKRSSLRREVVKSLFLIGNLKAIDPLLEIMINDKDRKLRKLIRKLLESLRKLYGYSRFEEFIKDLKEGKITEKKKLPIIQLQDEI